MARGFGQVAAVAQEAARGHRQVGDQLEPLALAQPGRGHRRRGDLRFCQRELGDEPGVAQSQAGFTQDSRLLGGGEGVGDLLEPGVSRRDQRPVGAGRRAAEQVEQLAELRARRALTRSAGAQHGGKAVVELHRVSGTRANGRRDTRASLFFSESDGRRNWKLATVANRDNCFHQ